MGFTTPGAGKAPADAEYVTNSADDDLTNETVVSPASDILVSGDIHGTTSLSPGFDSWSQVDADNPASLTASVGSETDGSSGATVSLLVDEDGGTTADYSTVIVQTPGTLPGGTTLSSAITVLLPAGAQFQIENTADPNGSNVIRTARAQIISP